MLYSQTFDLGGCKLLLSRLLAVSAVWLLAPSAAQAQGSGCTLQPMGSPSRQVIRCPNGLAVEAVAGSDYTLADHGRDGIPDSASLRSGALLVESPEQGSARKFLITTPQAVAAVRGTQWVVDVGGPKTAVFVILGQVSVRRSASRRGVTLGPGQGVDVEPGTVPLEVKRWPPARAAALLARFGR
jgi:hypothetical protein